MSPRLRRLLVIAGVLLQFAPSIAVAQAPKAGIVTSLEGTVTVTTASLQQPRPLKFKDDLFVNDRVVTGDRSIARMLLGGKAVVTVRERSSLTITEVPGKATIALDSGKIAVAVAREKVTPGEEIEVRTPNAVAGVRGTVFVAEVSQATASLDAAQSAVTSSFYGFTGVVTLRMGGQVVTLNPGMYASATGLAPAISGVMTDAMRAVALAGLQARLKQAGGSTQELANEQAMGTTVATFNSSGAAAEEASAGPPPPPSGVTAPLLPGGLDRIPLPSSPPTGFTALPRKVGSSAFLVFGDRPDERTALAAGLASEFPSHVVVEVSGLPSDLSAFGTVWHVGAFAPITDAEQTRLRTFLGTGGGLHLTGERPCCEPLNASLTTFMRSVVDGGASLTFGGHGDITGPYTFNPGDRGGIGRRLLAGGVTQWQPDAPGGITGISGPNVLVTAASGSVVGGVWDETDLVGDAGRVTLLMDVNWLSIAAAEPVVRSINAFIDDAANTLRLGGPLFRSVGNDLVTAGDPLLDIAGYTVIGSSTDALVALSGSRVTLPGSLMRLADSIVTNGGSLVRVDGGAEIVQRGSEPLVWMSGGVVAVGGHLFDLAGRPEAVEHDTATGHVLGADRPIQPGPAAALFQADNGATVSVAGSAFKIDTAVLAATAPLLALHGSTLTTGGDAIALVKQARLEIPNDAVALVSLRGGILNVASGSLVNVAGGSRLGVAGSLVSLTDGSTLNILNGALLSVSGGSFVNIGGPLVTFSGRGNTLNVTNSYVPTALISGIPVYGPLSSFNIAGTPLAGLGTAGTITINGVSLTPTTPLSTLKGSLITVQGSGTVKIGN
jgi:FecR protein